MPKNLRRIVTGHDASGRSRIASDDVVSPGMPHVLNPAEEPDWCLSELWRLEAEPIINAPDIATGRQFVFPPPAGGLAIRMMELPSAAKRNFARRKERFAEAGSATGFDHDTSRHQAMHKTDTVDFIIVISGRMRLILDEGETMVGPGDVVVQRGTNHAWENPDETPCLFAAVMIDAKAS